MLGDIYCLNSNTYTASLTTPSKAIPILLGVPHDSDPHFSPEGDKIVWRSDAELGLENIWVKEWRGCAQENIRPILHEDENVRRDLRKALLTQESDEALLAGGVKETAQRKVKRLTREGRYGGEQNVY